MNRSVVIGMNKKHGPNPGHGVVVLNAHGDPEYELLLYAKEYHALAKEAVQNLRDDEAFGNSHVDFKSYPICFLYRHAIELHLKSFLLAANPMITIDGHPRIDVARLRRSHDIDFLREETERLFDALGWSLDPGLRKFQKRQDFRDGLRWMSSIDPGSTTFRYPMKTNGERALVLPKRFNLFLMCEFFDEVLDFFADATYRAHHVLEDIQEGWAANVP